MNLKSTNQLPVERKLTLSSLQRWISDLWFHSKMSASHFLDYFTYSTIVDFLFHSRKAKSKSKMQSQPFMEHISLDILIQGMTWKPPSVCAYVCECFVWEGVCCVFLISHAHEYILTCPPTVAFATLWHVFSCPGVISRIHILVRSHSVGCWHSPLFSLI